MICKEIHAGVSEAIHAKFSKTYLLKNFGGIAIEICEFIPGFECIFHRLFIKSP